MPSQTPIFSKGNAGFLTGKQGDKKQFPKITRNMYLKVEICYI